MTRVWIVAALLLQGCGPAITHKAATRTAAAVPIGPRIDSEDEFTAARADLDALPADAPDRAGRRARLETWLLTQLNRSLDGNHLEEAYDFFKQTLTLYDADELKQKRDAPALLAAADRTERAFRRRGAHEEVLTTLAVQLALTRNEAPVRARYAQVVTWLRSGGSVGETASGPDDTSAVAAAIDGRERVIDDLEAVAKVWPSRFIVDELSALYLERPNNESQIGLFNRKLRKGADLRELIQSSGKGVGLAYELARLYLRVSQPDEAAAQVKKLAGQPGDDPQVRTLVEKYAAATAQPKDAVLLAQLFAQPGRDDRDVSARVCRDAARRFPAAPEPRMCAGQFALNLDQLMVAVRNFEEAVKLDPGRLETWEALARLYQTRLFQVVNDENMNIAELEKQLKHVEGFHAAAAKRFPEKTIKPSMADALFEVGRGYYNAGRVTDAVRYLERTIAMAPTTQALELLGQIRLKKGEGKEAVALFEKAAAVPRGDKNEQLWWRAKLRRQLGDALDAAVDKPGAETTRKAALADWDVLIAVGLTPEASAEAALEKAKLHYQLGDRDASLISFGKAIDAAPDRGSTYADAIAFLVPRGELEEALDAYHRALGRNEVTDYLKVYCSLWIIDLARRAKQPEDPLAQAFLKSTDGTKWYDSLARWATGREGEAVLTARADTPARKAEWAFYRAMRAHAEGKPDDARALWKQVIDTDMMAFFEYDMAAFYLRLGAAPAQPILKSKPAAPRSSSPRAPPGSI